MSTGASPPLPPAQVGLQGRGGGRGEGTPGSLLGHHPPPSGLTPCSLDLSRVQPVAMTVLHGIFRIALLQAVSLKLLPGNYEITYCQKMHGAFFLNHDQ